MQVDGCVVVVTGGASGLGEACARMLAKFGARIAILDVSEERGRAVASDLGGSAIFCKTDVRDEKTVQDALEKTIEAFGALHVAVNCAGVPDAHKILDKRGPIPIEHFNNVVQINLIGSVNVVRLGAERMVRNRGNEDGEKGVIINTASIAAFEGQIGQAAYSASKAALVGMTLPLAREFADYGLRIVTISPGFFETPMADLVPEKIREALIGMIPFPRRLGQPAEFALLVKHVIENPFINGTTIRLDAATRMAAR